MKKPGTDNVIKFDVDEFDKCNIARARFVARDFERAILFARDACRINPNFSIAHILLADSYRAIGCFSEAVEELFKILYDDNPQPEYVEKVVNLRLAQIFAQRGERDVVEYYMRDDADYMLTFDGDEVELEAFTHDELLLRKGYEFFDEDKFVEATECALSVRQDSDCANNADHLLLRSLSKMQDIDRMEMEAERILKKDKNHMTALLSAALAYGIKGDTEKKKQIEKILAEREYNSVIDLVRATYVFIDEEAHDVVLKLCDRILEIKELDSTAMLLKGCALYNLGKKDEAYWIFRRAERIYGDYCAAEAYIEEFNTNPDNMDYGVLIMLKNSMERMGYIKAILSKSKREIADAVESDERFCNCLRWLGRQPSQESILEVLTELSEVKSRKLDNILREYLIWPGVDFDVMLVLIFRLLDGKLDGVFKVVSQERFKKVNVRLPSAFYHLPSTFRKAVGIAVCDIVYTDELPDSYIERLVGIVDEIVSIDDSGKLCWHTDNSDKIVRLRSARSICAVLLSQVYFDDPEPEEDNIFRYNLSKRTFDRYYEIIFGKKKDEE